ncbi:hypothetical protein FHH43_00425 [Clostridium perfringens]|nr:hypothetical protein [Clostridium perfringens]
MKGSGECMVKVLTIDDNLVNCNIIKSNIPFSINEKLIELYIDWDYKKEPLYDYMNTQCDAYPFITPYVENYFNDIIELLKNSEIKTPKNIYYNLLDDYSNSVECKNIDNINNWYNSHYSYNFTEEDDLFFELSSI